MLCGYLKNNLTLIHYCVQMRKFFKRKRENLMERFKQLGISEKNISTLIKKGFKKPTEIQELTIPVLIGEKKDVISQAQTGTGKTAAFALPLIETLDTKSRHVQAIVLTPTRELAIQVCNEINSLKGDSPLTVMPIYGGQSINTQLSRLRRGCSIVVGTPGRILDHIRRRSLRLDTIKYFILDEADEMLNMGFIDDIETILKETPEKKRILLFSATMPYRIKKLAENYMAQYVHIKTKAKLTTNLTEQKYYIVRQNQKFDLLCNIINCYENFYGLIFCHTKVEVSDLAIKLQKNGFKAEAFHGDFTQTQRETTLSKFRKRQVSILVATDVAARGIDIMELTHVINYSMPDNPEKYVHRIGRTGRAGKKGLAITFVEPRERNKFEFIKKITKAPVKRGKLITVEDYKNIKKERITKDIISKDRRKNSKFFKEWSDELLQDNPPEELVENLLQAIFEKSN